MIVVSNVERNQFKFFDLRVTLKNLCKIIDTFCYAFSEVTEKRVAYGRMAIKIWVQIRSHDGKEMMQSKEGRFWSKPQIPQ